MQTGEGRAGGEAGPGLGYREVKRWEEEAEYRKLRILAEGTSHVVSMLQDSQHSPPPPPHFPLVPFPFIQTPDPRESPHWAVTPGAGSILGDPNCHWGWRFEATDTTNLRRSRDPEAANTPQSTWQERKHLGWLKVIIPSSL